MDNELVVHDFFPFFKDGRVERYSTVKIVPPSLDHTSGVGSKDVVISPDPIILARIFVPCTPKPNKKLPLIVYYHGGGFYVGSAFGQDYHDYLNLVVSKANVVVVSVEYRLAPEVPVEVCYEDSWAALQWVAMHAHGYGPETWLNNYVDFRQIFLMGDSVGANIAYNMAYRVGSNGLPGVKLVGLVLIHPYFGGKCRYDEYLTGRGRHGGLEGRRLKPGREDVAKMRCEKVLVFVGGRDEVREGGVRFYEEVKRNRRESVEIVEHEGAHVFHLRKPLAENAVDMMKRVAFFVNQYPNNKMLPKM